jgi:hypothetical protein
VCVCVCGGGGLLVGFGRVYRRSGLNHTFSWCFMVNISGGARRFIPMVMVAQGEDATSALGLF